MSYRINWAAKTGRRLGLKRRALLGLVLLAFLVNCRPIPSGPAFKTGSPPLIRVRSEVARWVLLKKLPVHIVARNETLSGIGRYYFVDVRDLAGVNQLPNPDRLPTGMMLRIPPVRRENTAYQSYRFDTEQSISGLCHRFGLDRRQFRQLNPEWRSEIIRAGIPINLPRPKPAAINRIAPLHLARPVRGLISSRYGWRWGRMHYGLDLAAPLGAPVWAVASGRVLFAGWLGSYGYYIKLQHHDFCSGYGHLSRILVRPGQWVGRGTVIGRVGATGRAFGNHLHFELEKQGQKVNPQTYLHF